MIIDRRMYRSDLSFTPLEKATVSPVRDKSIDKGRGRSSLTGFPEFIINLSIAVLFAGIVVLLIYEGRSMVRNSRHFWEKEKVLISSGGQVFPQYIERKHKDYSRFLEEIEKKDIFTPPYFEETMPVSGINRGKIKKIIEGLRLVGIKAGEAKKVIIEDKSVSKTFYLKEGDNFSEDIKVEKIDKDSVILNSSGERFELYL